MADGVLGTEAKTVFLLEPVCCLIRIGMLSFEEVGTKIAIERNRLRFMSPNAMQPILRWYSGHSRDELYFLLRPIVVGKMRLDTKANTIFQFALSGLKRLRETYLTEASTASHCLKLFSSYLSDDADPRASGIQTDVFADELYQQYDDLWTSRQLSIVSNLFDEAATAPKSDVKNYLRSIDSIVQLKEEASLKLLADRTKNLLKSSDRK